MGLLGPGRLERVKGHPQPFALGGETEGHPTAAPPRATLTPVFAFVLSPDLCLLGRVGWEVADSGRDRGVSLG